LKALRLLFFNFKFKRKNSIKGLVVDLMEDGTYEVYEDSTEEIFYNLKTKEEMFAKITELFEKVKQ